MIRSRVGGAIRRRGTARLLHISRILMVRDFLELNEEQMEELRDIRMELARKLIKTTADIHTARFDSFNTLSHKPVNSNNCARTRRTFRSCACNARPR